MRILAIAFMIFLMPLATKAGVQQIRFDAVQVVTAGTMSGSINSTPIDLDQYKSYSCQAVWTGAPVGNVKLQISDDIVSDCSSVVNWIDYTSSSQATGGAAGSYLWNVSDANYRCVRVVYARTSGSGSINVVCGRK